MTKLLSFSKGQIIFLAILLAAAIILSMAWLNADVYPVQVRVVAEPEKIELNPVGGILDFGSLASRMSAKRYVRLKNQGFLPAFVWVKKEGALGAWMTVAPKSFWLQSSQEKRLTILLAIPEQLDEGILQGQIKIFKIPF